MQGNGSKWTPIIALAERFWSGIRRLTSHRQQPGTDYGYIGPLADIKHGPFRSFFRDTPEYNPSILCDQQRTVSKKGDFNRSTWSHNQLNYHVIANELTTEKSQIQSIPLNLDQWFPNRGQRSPWGLRNAYNEPKIYKIAVYSSNDHWSIFDTIELDFYMKILLFCW